MRVRVSLRCRSDLYIMTKALEHSPALLFFGDNEKNGGLRQRNNECHEFHDYPNTGTTVVKPLQFFTTAVFCFMFHFYVITH